MNELELYGLMLKGALADATEEEKARVDFFRAKTAALLEAALEGDEDEVKCNCVGMVLATIERAKELTAAVE